MGLPGLTNSGISQLDLSRAQLATTTNGLTLVVLCLFHGSAFLVLKTSDVVRERASAVLVRLVILAENLVVVFAGWTVAIADGGPWRLAAVGVPVVPGWARRCSPGGAGMVGCSRRQQ